VEKLRVAIGLLVETGTLPVKYRPHKLSTQYGSAWKCHIEPDWLLIWEQNDNALTLLIVDTGTEEAGQ